MECFRHGGGVPYARFPRFHEVMADDSGQSVMSSLETHVLPLIPGLRPLLERGIRWLDVGCGSGRVLNRLGKLFPQSRFEGRDLSTEAIRIAREDASAMNLSNVSFVAEDLSDFAETAAADVFDIVSTFDAIHDQAKPLSVLKGIRRTLKPEGVYLMQDIKASSHVANNIGHPIGTLLYTISCMHCMTVSLAQGGEGLGAMWGEERTLRVPADRGVHFDRGLPTAARHSEQLVRRQVTDWAKNRTVHQEIRSVKKSSQVRRPTARSGARLAPARNARAAFPGSHTGTITRRFRR